MKLYFATAAFAAVPFLMPAWQASTQPVHFNSALPQRNLLGNGGFEIWSHGTNPAGAVGPDLWYPMGTTANFYTQDAIDFARVPENPGCSAGAPYAVQVAANSPEYFISQSLTDYAGLTDRWITFTVRMRTDYSAVYPKIQIDDGHSTSEATALIGPGVDPEHRFTSLTVKHFVSKCATKLEFKIVPEGTIQVSDSMAVVGNLAEAIYVPVENQDPALSGTPLGAVLDWYRFDANMPVPDGFSICDGSSVVDAASPFVGIATPNLVNKFVRGVASPASIGTQGGADSVTVNTGVPHQGSGNPPAGFWFVLMNPLPPVIIAANEFHYHPVTVPTVPKYVGLLKIIRIR